MNKALYITEKPSVAIEFAKALNISGTKKNGYIESKEAVVTWCVGHLVTMSYPEKYDPNLKRWSLNTLPFIPDSYKYEVISSVKKQYDVVQSQLTRQDIDTIYICTDSGREGEYIYRLIDQMIGVENKMKKRVWINSQTEEEIRRGVKEARPLEQYDFLARSAYLRAIEDYLAGINFSRLLTLKYGSKLAKKLGSSKNVVIAVGRVMSCVLGMIVDREREIRNFVKTPFYKIEGTFLHNDMDFVGEWKAVDSSKYFESMLLFNEKGFKAREDAEKFIDELKVDEDWLPATIESINRKKEKKNPPLLFNLAELQNEGAKRFKLSPDQTLNVVQNLYEKKLVTYPRTDSRFLSSAVAKEITKHIKGLTSLNTDQDISQASKLVLDKQLYQGLTKTKYVNDGKITDHYAIIPTGEGLNNFNKLKDIEQKLYLLIVRRFLAIFYPPAVYEKLTIVTKVGSESFFTNEKVCIDLGYLEILKPNSEDNKDNNNKTYNPELYKALKKGLKVGVDGFVIKEGETSPPKPYTSGTIILAMENAGKLIDDDELREQIKGSGIGTSATRAEIIKKLNRIGYIDINNKTQIISSTELGELIYEVMKISIQDLLNPELTASWEKGLEMVTNGELDAEKYQDKLNQYIRDKVNKVLVKENKWLCPKCGKPIIKGKKSYGCSGWKQGCSYVVGRDE